MLCSTLVLGQGTVNLNNNFIPPGGSEKAYILGLDCEPMAKAVGRVEVLSADGTLISPVQDGTGNSFGADGLFSLGVLAVPGSQPGGSGTIFIRAWDNSTGPTYATATVKVESLVTLTGLGGGVIPPPSLGEAGNFTGIAICPEPGSWAMAAVGLAVTGCVIRRRGKASKG